MTLLTVLTFSGCTETGNDDTENDVTDIDNGDFLGTVVAIVNGEEITSEEVTMLQQSYMQQGQQLSEEEALDLLINQKVLNQQALQDQYMPTDEEAETELETLLQQQGMNLDDYKQQLAQMGMSYEESLQDFKENIAVQNYVETALEQREFEGLRDEAEAELESMLQLYNMTEEELTQQLAQMGMTYEDYLQDFKQGIAQEYLVEELREEADIKYTETEIDTNDIDNDTDDNDNQEILDQVVAIVNGEEITSEEVTMLQQSYMQQGQQLSEEDAIEQLIDQKILQQQALKDQYMPTDEEAETELETRLQQQGRTLEDYKQQLAQMGMSYEESLQDFKEHLAIQNYVEVVLEEKDYNITDQEAETELESMLQQYQMTKEQLIQQLAQMGMTYEDYLQDFKQGIAQEYLVEELREEANIEYM